MGGEYRLLVQFGVTMKIRQVQLRRFRGFNDFLIRSNGHVVLVGEPRAGRSNLIEGLRRTLTVDGTWNTTPAEFDFFDIGQRAEVEVILGDLSRVLAEQVFYDYIEWWNTDTDEIIDELDDPNLLANAERVVRLCYRAVWEPAAGQGRHWVDFPKGCDPDANQCDRVSADVLKRLPITFGRPSGKPLGLGARSQFRTVVDAADGNDFGTALEEFTDQLTQLTDDLSASKQITAALTSTAAHIASLLRTDPATLTAAIRFAPQGASLSGILRSLEPALHLGEPGPMPITRHGSTIEALLAVGEALAAAGIDTMATNYEASSETVVVFDDFGDHLNEPAGQHLAATIRRAASQAWLSTRRAAVVTAFDPAEIVRLSRPGGVHAVSYGPKPTTRPERLAVRHLHTQLAPAMAATAVAVVEGPHDRATLTTVQTRRLAEHATPLLAAYDIQLVDAAAADASGGTSSVERLAKLARTLGLRTVAVIDYDPARQAATELAAVRASAHVTIRLPEGYAIERLLMDGLDEDIIRAACIDVSAALGIQAPKDSRTLQDVTTLTGSTLEKAVIKWLKDAGGMHGPFITALPDGLCPPAVTGLLYAIVAAATDPLSPDYVQL